MQHLDSFKIIGISVETTNENSKSAEDMGKLWNKFYSENIFEKIPNKIGNEIYSLYTDYKSDYTGAYTAIIGAKVSTLNEVPEGLIGREFPSGNFKKFIAKGEMPNAVILTWQEIWENNKALNRKYSVDFEVYGPKSQNGDSSEVEIFVAVE